MLRTILALFISLVLIGTLVSASRFEPPPERSNPSKAEKTIRLLLASDKALPDCEKIVDPKTKANCEATNDFLRLSVLINL